MTERIKSTCGEFICSAILVFFSLSFGQIHWTQRNPVPMDMACVTWAGDRFVGVGGGAFISADGTDWSIVPNAPVGLSSVVWTGSQLVAIGGYDAYTSPDGAVWTKRTTGSTFTLFDIAWTGKLLAAVGSNGVIVTSPDGVTWTTRVTGSSAGVWLYSIGWTGLSLVATGTGLIRTSYDGIVWDAYNGPTSSAISYIASTDSATIFAGGFDDTRFYNVKCGSDINSPGGHYGAGVWSGTLLVAVGSGIVTSPDGCTWTRRESGILGSFSSVAWNGTIFVAVGPSGCIVTSPDGMEWTSRGTKSTADLTRVQWVNNRFIAFATHDVVNGDDINSIFSSPDGVNWAVHPFPENYPSLTWTGSQYAAVSITEFLYFSYDGIQWFSSNIGNASTDFRAIAWNGSRLIAAGYDYSLDSCVIYSSTGAMGTWKKTVLEKNTWLMKMIWTGTKLVAVGYETDYFGTIRTSQDGENWSHYTSDTKKTLYNAASNGTSIVVVGDSGMIYSSHDDGATWQRQSCGITGSLKNIVWSGNQYVLMDDDRIGSFFVSPDGRQWTEGAADLPIYPKSVAAGPDGLIIAVGNGGKIFSSNEEILAVKKRLGNTPFSAPCKVTIDNSNKSLTVTMADRSPGRERTFRVFTMDGKCVRSMNSRGSVNVGIPLSGLAPGAYVLQIGSSGMMSAPPFYCRFLLDR